MQFQTDTIFGLTANSTLLVAQKTYSVGNQANKMIQYFCCAVKVNLLDCLSKSLQLDFKIQGYLAKPGSAGEGKMCNIKTYSWEIQKHIFTYL